ncbi:DUF262 domain-containing protein [candidate division WOR-3 bacterium]|nr:DUF262 domain-containing protein [candidate division WOR-3 bacterium]
MSYEHKTVKEIVEMIGRNEVYLPAIQRKFVWEPDQTESLFDSIMRGYPIGTFLFWFIRGEKKNDYTFYKFIQDYHERDRYLNDIAPKPELKEEIIGVLDGQQRLGSMYISFQGTYAYKKPYARRANDNAFPKRKLYLNLLKEPIEKEGEDFVYEFKFLTDNEARHFDEKHLWFLVRNVLTWGEDPEIDEYYDKLLENDKIPESVKEIIKNKRKDIKKVLRILHLRLVLDKLISYYKIEEQDLDNILDIFVRVNSGGTILSKSDLLFSTIVANWEEGRQEIESFLQSINKRGDGFWFDNDFIMRSCLVLTDCPILFKVKSFKKENIMKIKSKWEGITSSISKAVDLLVEFGFNGENLTSQNAVIPIAYHFLKGGDGLKESKNNIRKYIIHALLKQTYGGQGDRVLANIRDALTEKESKENGSKRYKLRQNTFSFDLLKNAKLPGAKSLKITDDDVEEILEYRKGPYTFMVLSLLYPNLRLGQVKFHQDHIHPASLFTDAKLRKYGISQDKWKKWQEMKDMLPNLQLMEGSENESKNKTPFKDWLNNTYSDETERNNFMKDNYIPEGISIEFIDFEMFYEKRKKILEEKIKEVLQ